MLEFSASATTKGKIAYKNYERMKVKNFARIGELARDHSLSSFFYKDGVTDSGEKCRGHKAARSISGAGNVMFGDFDNKGATLKDLEDALKRVGAAGWIGPSKSWSPEILKFHVAVAFNEPLPEEKEAFELLYRATMQYLGLEDWYDPCMHSPTQQLAPHWHTDGPNLVIDGELLNMTDVLARYTPGDGEDKSAKLSVSFAGEVPSDTVFVRASDGAELTIKEILELVKDGGKVRVWCIFGHIHDGRRDTALVRGGEPGIAYYYCSGGRCKETLILRDPQPFEEEEEEVGEVVVADLTDIHGVTKSAQLILSQSPVHTAAFGAKAKEKQREQAVGWVCQRMFELCDIRMIEGSLRWFDGVKWSILFANENEMTRWVQGVFKAVGFEALAHNLSAVSNVVTLLRRTVRICDGIPGGISNMVNLGNGMLDMSSMKLVPHEREQLFCTVLPFDYDPRAKAPEWERFIDRIMLGSEKLKRALQDAIGYLFARAIQLEVMIGLVGEGANGKSTLIDVISALVGEAGASHIPLQSITKATGDGLYARVGLSGRLVNFTGELSPRAMESTEFKNLITGRNILARDPFGKAFTLVSTPKHVAAMNSTEDLIKEKTHGFMRRLHMIPFRFTVPQDQRDLNLGSKLLAELPGIMNWALEGTKRVIETGRLGSAIEMTNLLEQIKLDSNPVQQYLEERTEKHKVDAESVQPKSKLQVMAVGVSELYQKYSEFCKENTYQPLGRNAFSKECERLGVTKLNLSVKVEGEVVKASGFYLRMLEPKDWKEPGYKPKLLLVT